MLFNKNLPAHDLVPSRGCILFAYRGKFFLKKELLVAYCCKHNLSNVESNSPMIKVYWLAADVLGAMLVRPRPMCP